MKDRTILAIGLAAFLTAVGLVVAQEVPASGATITARPEVTFKAASVNPVAATHTVTTQVSYDPDSGDAGNYWGLDTYAMKFTLTRVKQVAKADCGSGAKRCYLYDYTMTDKGTTQTVAGQESPGNPAYSGGKLLDVVEQAAFSGGTTDGSVYSSYKRAYTQYVPATLDENGVPATGNYTVGNWVLLFWGGAAKTADNTLGADAGWTYTAAKGADSQCPGYSGKWADSQANDWGDATGYLGNILAPNAADCSTQS